MRRTIGDFGGTSLLVLAFIFEHVVDHYLPALPELGWHIAEFAFVVLGLIWLGRSSHLSPLVRKWRRRRKSAALLILSITIIVGCAFWWLFRWSPKNLLVSPSGPGVMPTATPAAISTPGLFDGAPSLHDLYNSEHPYLNNHVPIVLTGKDGTNVTIDFTLHMDFNTKSKFVSVYIPSTPLTYDICHDLPKLYEKFMNDAIGSGKFYMTDPADPTVERSDDLIFTRVIFIYHEDLLSLEQRGALEGLYREDGLAVHFRDTSFATTRWFQKKVTPKQPQPSVSPSSSP